MIPTILTQQEVAAILKCSISKIVRLRRDGRIAFLPGRPVKFLETDLQQFIDDENRRKQAEADAKKPRPLTREELTEHARLWALNAVLVASWRRKPKE